jgi:hypothetical protein
MSFIVSIDVKAYRDAFFGVGSGPILLDDVRCTGSESTLLNCQHRAIGEHDCVRTKAAGVSCDECQLPCNIPLYIYQLYYC